MTDTPLTDALTNSGADYFGNKPTPEDRFQHMRMLARTLERQLAAATARLEAAEGVINIGIKLRQELTDENSGLRAKLEAAEKDAARYRWVSRHVAGDEDGNFCFDVALALGDLEFDTDEQIKHAFDAAIDAAKGSKP